jgi:hypothetical protein
MPSGVKDPRILKLKSTDEMMSILVSKGKPFDEFKKGDKITVWNKMEKNYSYVLQEDPGKNMSNEFKPYANPGEILAGGAFEGKYLNDCLLEFPAEWFLRAIALDKLRPSDPTVDVNGLQADSRLPLSEWKKKAWVPGGSKHSTVLSDPAKNPDERVGKSLLADPNKNPDERGWFQWYCRYWLGRRLPDLDAVQIGRWRAFKRHSGGVKANCRPGDLSCRPRQRQALLQWSWNPKI